MAELLYEKFIKKIPINSDNKYEPESPKYKYPDKFKINIIYNQRVKYKI